jgi:hypothetical protein
MVKPKEIILYSPRYCLWNNKSCNELTKCFYFFIFVL